MTLGDLKALAMEATPKRSGNYPRADVAGQRFGRLTAIEHIGMDTHRTGLWACRCDCGTLLTVRVNNLRSGNTKSCGCLQREIVGDNSRTHGEGWSRSAEYIIWQGMKNRCKGYTSHSKKHYADRGITVCERWQSYENFLADMGRRPTAKHSIDRINNDGIYEPGNCRWATHSEQMRNRRKL